MKTLPAILLLASPTLPLDLGRRDFLTTITAATQTRQTWTATALPQLTLEEAATLDRLASSRSIGSGYRAKSRRSSVAAWSRLSCGSAVAVHVGVCVAALIVVRKSRRPTSSGRVGLARSSTPAYNGLMAGF